MYASVPQVSVSLQDAQWDDDTHAWLRLDVIGVTNAGFKLRCGVDKISKLNNVRVRWMSLPN